MKTGITFNSPIAGLVAQIEEREAAVFCGYTWKEWLNLERIERAAGVAHYRMHQLIERHGDDAVSRESDRRMKAARK